MIDVQPNDSEMISDLKNFLEMTTSDDGVADIIFILKNGSCPAHKYILSVRCPNFDKVLVLSNKAVVKLPDVDCYIFQQFLSFVYTGDCDFLHAIDIENSLFQNRKQSKSETYIEGKSKEAEENPMESFRSIAKTFGCSNLLGRLKKSVDVKTSENVKEEFVFSRLHFQDLYDIVLKCSDGEIKAHRCVLSARMEYFGNMLSDRWSGVSLIYIHSIFQMILKIFNW